MKFVRSSTEYDLDQHGVYLSGRPEGESAFESLLEEAQNLGNGELIISFRGVEGLSHSFCDSAVAELFKELEDGSLTSNNLTVEFAHISNPGVESTLISVLDDIGIENPPILAS